MGKRTRRLTSLLVSITSGAGAVALLIGTLLGAGTLNCGDRSFTGDGALGLDARLDAPVQDAPKLDGTGQHPCEPLCKLLNICTGGSSRGSSSGSGPGSPGWVAKCVASCIHTYTTSMPGSLSGGKSSYRQKVDCGAKATTCAALDACLK